MGDPRLTPDSPTVPVGRGVAEGLGLRDPDTGQPEEMLEGARNVYELGSLAKRVNQPAETVVATIPVAAVVGEFPLCQLDIRRPIFLRWAAFHGDFYLWNWQGATNQGDADGAVIDVNATRLHGVDGPDRTFTDYCRIQVGTNVLPLPTNGIIQLDGNSVPPPMLGYVAPLPGPGANRRMLTMRGNTVNTAGIFVVAFDALLE